MTTEMTQSVMMKIESVVVAVLALAITTPLLSGCFDVGSESRKESQEASPTVDTSPGGDRAEETSITARPVPGFIGEDGRVSTSITLESGERLPITGLNIVEFTEGPPALVLRYETKIPISNKVELRKQVDEVWRYLKTEVERRGLTAAAIAPKNTIVREGNLSYGKSFGFSFIKQEDGTWVSSDGTESKHEKQ